MVAIIVHGPLGLVSKEACLELPVSVIGSSMFVWGAGGLLRILRVSGFTESRCVHRGLQRAHQVLCKASQRFMRVYVIRSLHRGSSRLESGAAWFLLFFCKTARVPHASFRLLGSVGACRASWDQEDSTSGFAGIQKMTM